MDCLDARWFSAMFSNDRNATMYDRRSVKRDTDISSWNRRWQVLLSYRPHCVNPVGTLDMPVVCHEDESTYVLYLVALVDHAVTVRCVMGLEARCLEWPYE